jgi:hypothetical protein
MNSGVAGGVGSEGSTMAALTGLKFTIRCRNCCDATNFKLSADEPDAMVECSCWGEGGVPIAIFAWPQMASPTAG